MNLPVLCNLALLVCWDQDPEKINDIFELFNLRVMYMLTFPQTSPGSVFNNHSQEHSLSFSPILCQFECNTTSDWLNHMDWLV